MQGIVERRLKGKLLLRASTSWTTDRFLASGSYPTATTNRSNFGTDRSSLSLCSFFFPFFSDSPFLHFFLHFFFFFFFLHFFLSIETVFSWFYKLLLLSLSLSLSFFHSLTRIEIVQRLHCYAVQSERGHPMLSGMFMRGGKMDETKWRGEGRLLSRNNELKLSVETFR